MSADEATTSDNQPLPAENKIQPTEAKDEPAASSVDETKRKFREALEAKKNRRGEDHIDDGQQQVHAHGPVDSKRVFRRKTG